MLGWYVIARQYYDRYRRPLMHTETNNVADGGSTAAERWLWKEFLNVKHMRSEGIPILGFTWYSLTDQVDWHSALQGGHRIANPVGLVDLGRRPRPVGRAYAALVGEFKGGVRDAAHFEAAVAAGNSPPG